MIQRIATFIEWSNCGKKQMTIGVYNDAQSAERFKRLYHGQRIGENTITVRSLDNTDSIEVLGNCDILYIGEVNAQTRLQILQKISHKGVLIIGNTREDARSGVAVVLLEDGNRYRILINQDALKESNLHADYRLLKLAELVSAK